MTTVAADTMGMGMSISQVGRGHAKVPSTQVEATTAAAMAAAIIAIAVAMTVTMMSTAMARTMAAAMVCTMWTAISSQAWTAMAEGVPLTIHTMTQLAVAPRLRQNRSQPITIMAITTTMMTSWEVTISGRKGEGSLRSMTVAPVVARPGHHSPGSRTQMSMTMTRTVGGARGGLQAWLLK